MKRRVIRPLSTCPTIAELLTYKIGCSDMTQREIALASGFDKPNFLSMVKQGHCRLPLERLGPIARTLDIDCYELFCLWMHEHYADTWRELAKLIQRAR